MSDRDRPRPLRIAQIAPLFAPVPPETYGGTERIVSYLTEELVRRGHEVTLFATGDSRTSARLRVMREVSLFESWGNDESWRPEICHLASAVEALRLAGEFDLLHYHMGTFSLPFSVLSRRPMLHTIPSPLGMDDLWMIHRFPEAAIVARSHRQIVGVNAGRRGNIHVLYNGCDFNKLTFSAGPGRYLAFLGRMAEEKNPLDAIRVARQAGMPLVLAGEPWDENERAYFEREVRPWIDGRNVEWIGPVDDRQKAFLFRDAAALLFPIQCEEAFGNVMIEAMACGVPVLAYNRGAVPEVVDTGITGFYGNDVEQLTSLVDAALKLPRRAVREHAEGRFSVGALADRYLDLYHAVTVLSC